MSLTIRFELTIGRDPEPAEERDSDHVGTHHDAGRTIGFSRTTEDDR